MSETLREQVFHDLERVMNLLTCGLMGSDTDGNLLFINQRLLDWLGYRKSELIGHPAARILPAEIHDQLQSERAAALAGDVRMRLTVLQRKDSTTFPVLVVPQRIVDDEGEAVGGFSAILDMGGVETAKPLGYHASDDVPERLDQIARELQAIGLATRLSGSGAPLPLEHPELAQVSGREREVLAHLVAGKRVPAIAKELFISQETVRGHLKSMFRKLGVRSQSDLIQKVNSLRGS